MFKRYLIFIFVLFFQCVKTYGQDYTLPLYDTVISNSNINQDVEKIRKSDITKISNVQNPTISVYLPTKRFATGQAVIICPGGGYWVLAYDIEGTDIARYLNSIGVAAIVLKYRLPVSKDTSITYQCTLNDVKRGMRLVRYNAKNWNINPDKIGIMGFSAGGHLASTIGTHFDYGNNLSTDVVEKQSNRPDFMILVYPVISFVNPCASLGTRDAFLGKNPKKELASEYSNELHVSSNTPPTFLVHANDDTGISVENSLIFYQALRAQNVPVELHVLSEGGHGFGLAIDNNHVASWTNSLKLWLNTLK